MDCPDIHTGIILQKHKYFGTATAVDGGIFPEQNIRRVGHIILLLENE